MKFIHITDTHGTARNPEGRKDVYSSALLKKMQEIKAVAEKEKPIAILHTGDLFHSPRVSNKFAGELSEIIKEMKVPFIVVPGNHDIEGYNISTIDQTTLGLLDKAGVVIIARRNAPLVLEDNGLTVSITGQEYTADIDTGENMDLFKTAVKRDFDILAVHAYIADKPQHPSIPHILAEDIETDADVILSGHYHQQFEFISDDDSFAIYNPGSLMRIDRSEYNKTHIPTYGILEIIKDEEGISYTYDFRELTSAAKSSSIFDYDSAYEQKENAATLDRLQKSLKETIASIDSDLKVDNIIRELGKEKDDEENLLYSPGSIASALDKYNKALALFPEMAKEVQGYIQASQPKKIKSVDIKNFQSHKDTHIDFDDKLNIIVGESNEGKTAVLRAMLWAIGNEPSGSDFITTGKSSTKVKITFDDDSYIERSRSRSKSGTYKAGWFDEERNFKEEVYNGFGTSVPLEIKNVHQMPKVSLTKDISAYLNVMNQLDPSFLVTESPQNKAAIIGRITGTHIVDTAIKEINKECYTSNVKIKITKEDKEQKEKALSDLGDIDNLEEAAENFSNLIAQIREKAKRNRDLGSIKDTIKEAEKGLIESQDEFNKNKAICNLSRIVQEIKGKTNRLHQLLSIKKEIVNLTIIISEEERAFRETDAFVRLQPVIAKMKEKTDMLMALSSLSTRVSRGKIVLKETEQDYDIKSRLLNILDRIVKPLEKRTITLVRLISFRDEVNNKLQEVKDLEYHTKENIFTLIQALQEKQALENEMNKFIEENKICPCCGHQINENEAHKCAEFFKRKQKGVPVGE